MPEPARVLLLEDDALVRHFVQAALDGMELTLLACASVAEARQMLCVQTVQLVLTDMHLPDGSGLDLLHWMQEQGHASRTVVFSGGVDAALQTPQSPAATEQLNARRRAYVEKRMALGC